MAGSNFRRFKEPPTLIFVNEVRDRILATAQPELIEELYRAPVSNTEPYDTLASKITIDGEKRPNRDKAPCPMCTPNRFLHGFLVYLRRLEAVAFIGHCCADKHVAAEADKNWHKRLTLEQQETFLLAELPLVSARIAAAKLAAPAANEALRVYRQFRNRADGIHKRLREIIKRGGMLSLVEIVDAQVVANGPRGFGTTGSVREVPFGAISGATMLYANWNPVRELDEKILGRLHPLDQVDSEESVVNFIVAMSARERSVACALLNQATQNYAKFATKMADFTQFFETDNLQRIADWGMHPANPKPVTVRNYTEGKRRVVVFRDTDQEVRLLIAPVLWEPVNRHLPSASKSPSTATE